MTFDHDIGYSFPLFSYLLKNEGRRKWESIAKIIIKGHAFLFDRFRYKAWEELNFDIGFLKSLSWIYLWDGFLLYLISLWIYICYISISLWIFERELKDPEGMKVKFRKIVQGNV